MLRERTNMPITPRFREEYDREIDQMRRAMPADRFAAAWAAGRALELEHAVAEALAVTVSSQPVAQPPSHGLTPREAEVLRLLAEGYSNPGIADALFISPKTAANHVASILAKFGVESRTAAVSHALRHHLI
jgi:DNA-binding NarL/FixJ family response regulator